MKEKDNISIERGNFSPQITTYEERGKTRVMLATTLSFDHSLTFTLLLV